MRLDESDADADVFDIIHDEGLGQSSYRYNRELEFRDCHREPNKSLVQTDAKRLHSREPVSNIPAAGVYVGVRSCDIYRKVNIGNFSIRGDRKRVLG